MTEKTIKIESRSSTSRLRTSVISVTLHEKNLRNLRCCISRNPAVTLHHCHGGSMKDAGWHVGMGQKQNPWLQIPLHEHYHTGGYGIDSGYGVETWERHFGTQTEHLIWVNAQLPYDIFQQALEWEGINRANTKTSQSGGKE